MPEGHLVHRHARDLGERFEGRPVEACSPQGRFADGAATIDRSSLTGAEAYGKHLFLRFDADAPTLLHVHLGRQGKWLWAAAGAAPPASVRLRLASADIAADLIAPLVCELGDPAIRDGVVATLGPDPLRDDADVEAVTTAIHASRQPIGALLLDQSVLAGIGNVLRAELLNIVGVHPTIAGDTLGGHELDRLWHTTVSVMRTAVDEGRIITRRPPGVAVSELDEVEGRFAYGRDRCGRCDTPLDRLEIAGRVINACPVCQPHR